MLGEVYMIRHNVTGRMYIGRSQDVQKRIYQHLQRLRSGKHSVEDMQKDFDEYGNDFTVSILGEVDNNHLNLEIEMMDKYNSTTRGVGYNYKDPHITVAIRNSKKKRSTRAKLIGLIDSMTEEEKIYAYTLLSKLFKNEGV